MIEPIIIKPPLPIRTPVVISAAVVIPIKNAHAIPADNIINPIMNEIQNMHFSDVPLQHCVQLLVQLRRQLL